MENRAPAELLSTTETAHVLQVSRQTVVRLVDAGELKCMQLRPGSPRRIPKKELQRYIQARQLEIALP